MASTNHSGAQAAMSLSERLDAVHCRLGRLKALSEFVCALTNTEDQLDQMQASSVNGAFWLLSIELAAAATEIDKISSETSRARASTSQGN